jgi:hypothetical protein
MAIENENVPMGMLSDDSGHACDNREGEVRSARVRVKENSLHLRLSRPATGLSALAH